MRVTHVITGCVMAASVLAVGISCSAGTSKDSAPGLDGGGDVDTGGFVLDDSNPAFDVGDGPSADAPRKADDPVTCAEAAAAKTYVGCDFWPTPLTNPGWSLFDFAVVVANTGDVAADVTVTGPKGFKATATAPPNGLVKIYLPWVQPLKGIDVDSCGSFKNVESPTLIAPASAYHLVTTRPVIVSQFNALEYKGTGGPPGKDWSSCPGSGKCASTGTSVGCFSFTNDASLLLPSTAMTANYRFTAAGSTNIQLPKAAGGAVIVQMASYVGIVAIENGTEVSVTLSATSSSVAGGSIPAGKPGDVLKFSLSAGDVAEISGASGTPPAGGDGTLAGSLVQANKPIQVFTGGFCMNYPAGAGACDHVEQSVLPAETLGKQYVVTVPTSPKGAPVGHIVRFFGNKDGTVLTYTPSKPAGCPDALNAGQWAECKTDKDSIVGQDFEVTGTHEFGVLSQMLGGSLQDPSGGKTQQGDPSVSTMVATEQWRLKYVFLAPDDYESSFVDVASPPGAALVLDGVSVSAPFNAIGSSFGVYRIKLGSGKGGAHVLTSSKPVGLQVLGFGAYTSYQYPAGLNLDRIAPPPPPPK